MRAALPLLLLAFAANPGSAQEKKPPIWAEPVLAQPFDKALFRPIQPPAWVRETIGSGYTLSVMDGKARAAAAAHGVTLSEMNFVDPFYAYYDSKLLKRRSPHVPLDRLPKEIAEYKKLGVRILGVYPPCLQGEVYETQPGWRRIPTDTTTIPTIDMKKYPHGGMLCLLGPYGDFFVEIMAEILEKHPDVSAFSFDGLHYGGSCYCEHCRKNFKKETGGEIPKLDMNDLAFRKYQHWADRRMEDVVRRLQTRLKGINPEVALVTWSTNAGRFGHFLDIPRNMPARMNLLFDAPDQEFWLDETNRGTTIVPAFANAYIWATTNHRVAFSEPYILSHGNPYGKDSFPAHEIERRMMLALTHGAMPSIAASQPKHLQDDLYKTMDAVQARKPWLTHKTPEPWAALVMSDNTRNFYGRSAGKVEERYLAAVLGTFRTAVEEHLPVAVINDWNLTTADLAKYKVLILPNTASLDDAQAEAIRQFVKDGGGLVASLDTGLFDEYGSPRKGFALGDLFGVEYRGLADSARAAKDEIDVNFAKAIGPDYWEKRKSVFDFKQDTASFLNRGKMKKYVGDEQVTFKGPAVRVAVKGADAKIVGTMRAKDIAAPIDYPAVVTNTFGKGRVVYAAAGFDAAYYLYPYPYQRLVLKHAIQWAAGDNAAPFAVDAPMCVHTTLMRQSKDGERLIVHLFNDSNTTAHHAHPIDDVPLREEALPIHDITITFGPQYKFRKIHLEPGGQELELKTTGAGTRVVVPRLEVHALIVAELKPKK